MFTTRRGIAALLLLGAGLAPAHAQTSRYAAADSPDSPDNSAHALDALSSAANKPPAAPAPAAEGASRSQLAAVQGRLESFMRQSTAAADDNRAALADIRARLNALEQQLDRQRSGGDDPRITALTQRLEQDERLIAQLRGAQPLAAAMPAAPAPVVRPVPAPAPAPPAPVAAAPAAHTPAISCSDLSAGSDAAWSAAVAKAYPGYTLDSVDVGGGNVYVRKGGDDRKATSVDSVLQAVGCS